MPAFIQVITVSSNDALYFSEARHQRMVAMVHAGQFFFPRTHLAVAGGLSGRQHHAALRGAAEHIEHVKLAGI